MYTIKRWLIGLSLLLIFGTFGLNFTPVNAAQIGEKATSIEIAKGGHHGGGHHGGGHHGGGHHGGHHGGGHSSWNNWGGSSFYWGPGLGLGLYNSYRPSYNYDTSYYYPYYYNTTPYYYNYPYTYYYYGY